MFWIMKKLYEELKNRQLEIFKIKLFFIFFSVICLGLMLLIRCSENAYSYPANKTSDLNLEIGEWSSSIAIGDLKDDGLNDIVGVSYADEISGIFYQLPNNTFPSIPNITLEVGERPFSVAIGDLNNDTLNDIAIGNRNSNNAMIYFQQLNHTFLTTPNETLETGDDPFGIAIGDLNDNGLNDIIVTNFHDDNAGIYYQLLNNTFPNNPNATLKTENEPLHIVLGDLNYDNLKDIAISTAHENVTIYYQKSNNIFPTDPDITLVTGEDPNYIEIGDLNSDGLNDIIVSNGGSYNATIYYQQQDHTIPVYGNLTLNTGWNPQGIAIGDFNTDGLNDVAITNKFSHNISIYYQFPNNTISANPNVNLTTGQYPEYLTFGDLNNNGRYDLVVGYSGEDFISIYYQEEHPPNLIIDYPKDKDIYYTTQKILFDCSNSSDPEMDPLTFYWVSNISGYLGNKPRFQIYLEEGWHSITVYINDTSSNNVSKTVNITVKLNTLPKLEIASHQTAFEDILFEVEVCPLDNEGDELIFTDDTDLFDIDPKTRLISFIPTNDDVGNHIINISVTDEKGSIENKTLNFTIINTNDPPVLDVINDQILTEDKHFFLDINATDIDPEYSFIFFDNTTLFDIDTLTGTISFTPKNEDVGIHFASISVSDGFGSLDWQNVNFTVKNVNNAPIIEGVPNQFGFEDTPWDLDLTPYISDVDNITIDLTIIIENENVTVNDKILTFLYENGENLDFLEIKVTDGILEDNQTISVNILNINDPPILEKIENQTIYEDIEFNLTINAADIDNGDILTFSDNSTLFEINPLKGLISFTPNNEDVGVHFVNITVIDSGGAKDFQTVKFIIININDAPNISKVPDQFGYEDMAWNLNLTSYISDNDNSTGELTIIVDNENVTVKDKNLIFLYENGETFDKVKITVSDDLLSSNLTISVTIFQTNDAPQLKNIGEQKLKENSPFGLKVEAIDIDKGDVLTFFDNTTLFKINPKLGMISFIPTNEDVGIHFVNISVFDLYGSFDWEVVKFIIENVNNAPKISKVPDQFGFEDTPWNFNISPYISDIDNSSEELIISVDSDNVTVLGKILTFFYENGENSDTIMITVSDGILKDSQTINVEVINTNDPPQILKEEYVSKDFIAIEDEEFNLKVNAFDVDNDVLHYFTNSKIFQIDSLTGLISFVPSNEDVGNHKVNISVFDGKGGFDFWDVEFIVENTNDPPVLEQIGNLFAFEEKQFTYQVKAFDIDFDDNLTFSDDSEFFDIAPKTGVISFIPKKGIGSEKGEIYNVTITVTDSNGSKDQKTFEFIVFGEIEDEDDKDYTWLIVILFLALIGLSLACFVLNKKLNKIIGLQEKKEKEVSKENGNLPPEIPLENENK